MSPPWETSAGDYRKDRSGPPALIGLVEELGAKGEHARIVRIDAAAHPRHDGRAMDLDAREALHDLARGRLERLVDPESMRVAMNEGDRPCKRDGLLLHHGQKALEPTAR